MSKLTSFAKGITSGSRLMQGRTKIPTDGVLGIELTIRDYDIVKNNDGTTFPVIVFDELPENYYCGGKILNEIINGIDANGLRPDLLTDGLRVILGRKVTRDHKMCVTVTVLD